MIQFERVENTTTGGVGGGCALSVFGGAETKPKLKALRSMLTVLGAFGSKFLM